MKMEMKNLFKRHKAVVFLSVEESKDGDGIKTYFNPMISAFPIAYRKQLITFLQGMIEELQKDEK